MTNVAASSLRNKAEAFRALHVAGEPLLLPNVWDVASARIIEASGFPAIATTSAGIAFSLGYPDGQKITRQEMLLAVARIAAAVKVPVTADVESGYGSRPEDAADTARSVIEAGAVGMNLEDATGDPARPLAELPQQLEKIRAVRETASKLKVPLVLNARTDVYLLQVGDPAKRYEESVRRLGAYRDAGADCVFLPGLRDAATIGRLAGGPALSAEHSGCARFSVRPGVAESGSGPNQPGIRPDAGDSRSAPPPCRRIEGDEGRTQRWKARRLMPR